MSNSASLCALATRSVIYALSNTPHISVIQQMQMVAPVICRRRNKKKKKRREWRERERARERKSKEAADICGLVMSTVAPDVF